MIEFESEPEEDGLLVPDELAGKRLDVVLAGLFPDYSRSRLQSWLKDGTLTVDGQSPSASSKVQGGEFVVLGEVPDIEDDTIRAEPVPLDVVYEDEHLIVINKESNRVMHPAVGNRNATVQNGLLHLDPELIKIPRAGIVHRLDKDTTGLFVVARSLKAHQSLVEQLQQRSMGREYTAIVQGALISGGSIDEPIGRHPTDRKRMAIRKNGKTAITHYRILEKFPIFTALVVKLESGRTHQIRVHMSSLHHPLVGDQTYGGRKKIPGGLSISSREQVVAFPRQALHAHALTLVHPESGETMRWEVDLPEDMRNLLDVLRNDSSNASARS